MNTQQLPGEAGLIAVEDLGWTGVPIIALHDAGANASHWNPVQKALRPRRFVTLDLRGHGRSAIASDGRYDVAAMAADVRAITRYLGLREYVLLGHGLGADVALQAAALAGDEVRAVCLVAPGIDAEALPDDPKLRARLQRERAATRSEILAATFAAASTRKASDAVAECRAPLTVLLPPERAGDFGRATMIVAPFGRWTHLVDAPAVVAALGGAPERPKLTGVEAP